MYRNSIVVAVGIVGLVWGTCVFTTAGETCNAGETCSAGELQRFEAAEVHMGTEFRVVLYAEEPNVANRAMRAAFARVRELDQRLSDYQSDSELSLLSAASPHPDPVAVSDDLWRVLVEGQRVSKKSEGAFDVTVGPLTKLWRRSRRQRALPPKEQLHAALASVGYQHIHLDKQQKKVRLSRPHMRLDLGGIAQGFAADEALAIISQHGISSALVNASGDISVSAPPPGESGWQIGIGDLKGDRTPSRFVRLSNSAVSTSGDVFQYVEIGGVRYSHIVNPATGLGLMLRTSVTIVAPNCTLADALATAVCVAGPEKGLKIVATEANTEAYIVHQANSDTIQIWETPGMKKFWIEKR